MIEPDIMVVSLEPVNLMHPSHLVMRRHQFLKGMHLSRPLRRGLFYALFKVNLASIHNDFLALHQ